MNCFLAFITFSDVDTTTSLQKVRFSVCTGLLLCHEMAVPFFRRNMQGIYFARNEEFKVSNTL